MDSGNSACPNGCSGNGECNQRDGKCTCEPQFAGKDCSESKCKICYTRSVMPLQCDVFVLLTGFPEC